MAEEIKAIVALKKGEGRTLRAGGLWVYDNEIESITGTVENGKLVLDSTVEEQIITIKAIDELGTTICKEVALVNSWRKSNEKGFFYGPEELEKIEYAFDGITQSHITVVRWVLCVGCVIVFFTYVVFYAKYLQDKKREEE